MIYLPPWMNAETRIETLERCAEQMAARGGPWFDASQARGTIPLEIVARACGALASVPNRRPPESPLVGQYVNDDPEAVARDGGTCVDKSLALLALARAVCLTSWLAWRDGANGIDHVTVLVRDVSTRRMDPTTGEVRPL